MITSHDNAIGGYFELEPGNGSGLPLLQSAATYQSARSAMASALLHIKPATVWVPHFICGVVIEMLDTLGITVKKYSLTEKFGVPSDLDLGPSDRLICVDYFGICHAEVDAAIQRYGAEKVLVDASQSLYFKPCANYTVAYSPRKFVGVPDGGLLLSPYKPASALSADEAGSGFRSRHLHTRTAGHVEAGYLQYQEAEKTLADPKPQTMSAITKTMLATIDFDAIALRRRSNYETLFAALVDNGFRTLPLPASAVPLCFPVLDIDADRLRPELVSRRIFTPAYWPDASIPAGDRIGSMLRNRTLYLPCDQRYGDIEMHKICKALIHPKDYP
jgi:hypothetical protein